MIEFLAPPIVGAVIGYFTNYVAIKMVFRPVKPYYLFGKKIPFTPGLIPSKREKLAVAIAKVVKQNLLTEEMIKKRLNEEKVKKSIEQLVEHFLERFVFSDELFFHLKDKLSEVKIEDIVDPKSVEEKVETLTLRIVETLHGKSLQELLPKKTLAELEKFIDKKTDEFTKAVTDLSEKPEFKDAIHTSILRGLENIKNYLPIIPEPLLLKATEKLTDIAAEVVSKVTKDPQFQRKISKLIWEKITELLRKPIDISNSKVLESVKNISNEYFHSIKEKKLSDFPFISNQLLPETYKAFKKTIESKKNDLIMLASENLLKVIEIELPVILDSIDIEGLVRDRVNAMPVEEVEDILLKLINEELRYITLLGGILGFIIGSFQIILLL